MHDFDFLGELALIGAMAIAIILIFQKLRIPPVIGLIFTGIVLGPSGIGVVYDEKLIATLAELGVVLLLFTIGLEFSVDDLKRLKKIVLVGGFVQIVLTGLALSFLAYWFMFMIGKHISVEAGIFLGFAFSVSSTAICLKILSDREELGMPHGRIALGILIFQDIAIVPLMVGINFLAPDAIFSFEVFLKKVGFILLFGAALVAGFRVLMPRIVRLIASLHAREVLVIGALVICFGAAYLTSLAGLSLALGSFVAEMIIASTDESHQISATIDPFREAFSSIFFISVGLLLDIRVINLPLFISIALGVLLVKGMLVTGVSLFLGYSMRVSMMAGMALAQIGEFSFVLAQTGMKSHLINQEVFQAMLAIIVVTMIVTPAMIAVAPKVADQVVPVLGFIPLVSKDASGIPSRPPDSTIICAGEIHAAIIGFGVNGQNVAAVLHATNISYSVLEIDREIVKTMRRSGEPIYYGDCTEKKSLLRAGIDHARAVVLCVSDNMAVRKSIAVIREINNKTFIIVRARTLDEVDTLYKAGADVVVTEKFETSIQIFSQLLNHFTVDPELILGQQEIIRRECEKIFLKPLSSPIR
ncbi:cation:proton antiporter [Chlorobium phaeobacteroides]|uniref:Kef-type potassium/proton antiporter, CPA2 family n=1 Tax=Chlorobium phaeobacteroides (strain DSM 266 / SMG 266 / 2430) TaxID=290317 RepID=A1BEY8_CHLPD|nr:cation:proton antiporter [Chlorobium phaeobacteroides]ABL64965.1 Kef-type potassium/proton antiporter, CPA2 family [Chlorobium phaeobacteroides DSM 266]